MNILQIISGRGVNGALVYCKILCEELANRGHNVTLVCRHKSWMKANVDLGKVQVIESSLARLPFTEFKRVASLVRNKNIDLIHSHMTRGQNFAIGLKMMTGTPVVATAHNRHFEVHWNFNDFVIANSKSTYDYHARINRIPSKRMETIYCCSDFERLKQVPRSNVDTVREKIGATSNDFLIGVVGEIAARKGHIHFVHALPRIIETVPNAKVVFVGRFGRKQPHVRQIRKFILENGLAGRIRWVGRKSNVADYMAAADLTVVPSLEEPLGLVAIESLMAGTPVVASDTGGLTEIIHDQKTGLLVPPGHPAAISDAVIQLAQDKKLRHRLGHAGQSFVSEKFSPHNLIDQVETVYNRVLTGRRAAA